jgi:hypothetical protein
MSLPHQNGEKGRVIGDKAQKETEIFYALSTMMGFPTLHLQLLYKPLIN